MTEAYDFLREAGTWFLATAEGGQPRLRPMGGIGLYRDRVYFMTGSRKAVSRQLHANPRVELCAAQGDTWLRVEGSTVLDSDPAAREAFPPPQALYVPEGAELWYLRNCAAALYSGAELVKTWRF